MKGLNFFEKLVFFFNLIAAIILLLSYALPFLPPKTFPQLSVLSLGVPLLILINSVFFLYWLLKVKRQFLLSLVILVIGYCSFGSLYKFSTTEDVANESDLSIMSYNVRLFNIYYWIKEDPNLKDRTLNLIEEASPDILSIQEYRYDEKVDLSFYKYKYEKLQESKTFGQVIFSKYPIINSGSINFPNSQNDAIFSDIVKGKDTIRVYNIHLQSLHINPNKAENLTAEESERLFKQTEKTFEKQNVQTDLFNKHKAKCPYKIIVTGDFNNTAFSYVYNQIKGDLQDAFKVAGNGFGSTYDFKFFPVRIDFILIDKSFTINHFKTFNERYSDHYPILAKIKL